MRRVMVLNAERSKGYFHKFGVASEEVTGGILTDSVAIIELEDGTVNTFDVSSIVFLDEPKEEV